MNKKNLLSLVLFAFAAQANAQLYSSGNNVIGGSSVGIGTSTPSLSSKLHIYGTGSVDLLRLDNPNASTGISRFTFNNDQVNNYATFTKYGSTVPGGYPGVTTSFPYANLFAFGNNNGPFLNVSSGNVGLALFKGGTTRLKLFINYSSENLGLGGNSNPATNVHINSAVSGDTLKITNSTTGHNASDGLDIRTTGNAASIVNRENSTLSFGTNNTSRMSIAADGKITIGSTTTPGTYKLYVESGILTEKVKVALKSGANWADYVFSPDYTLRPLNEVAEYIQTHRHLPGVPSADEVVAEGLDLGAMDAKLLEKIEELTLYMIQLQQRVAELEKANTTLTQQLKTK
jgi:hypothetical protein